MRFATKKKDNWKYVLVKYYAPNYMLVPTKCETWKGGYLYYHSKFGSIVLAIVYKLQNVLKVVVHVIIIDQCNQIAR